MYELRPDTVLAALRSAGSSRPDPALDAVLRELRRRWLQLARHRRPELIDDAEDAVQSSLAELLRPETLDGLRDPTRVVPFSTALFWNHLRGLARVRRREIARRHSTGNGAEDRLEDVLASAAPGPEDVASARERLAIVTKCLAGLDIAQAKFVEDLPDRVIADRFGKSHDAVRNHLKRVRRVLRSRLMEDR